jgi:hypothetical protein
VPAVNIKPVDNKNNNHNNNNHSNDTDKDADVYRKILFAAISKTHNVSTDTKKLLRGFRKDHNISNEKHAALLRECGWTEDEYEDGERV